MMMVASSQAQFPLSRAKQLGNAVESYVTKSRDKKAAKTPGQPVLHLDRSVVSIRGTSTLSALQRLGQHRIVRLRR
jgi:hypothetical protein